MFVLIANTDNRPIPATDIILLNKHYYCIILIRGQLRNEQRMEQLTAASLYTG